jgi:hypothetical protein
MKKTHSRKADPKVPKAAPDFPSMHDAADQLLTQARRMEKRAYHYLERAMTARAMANSFLRSEVSRFQSPE